jgi:hypothetical protein
MARLARADTIDPLKVSVFHFSLHQSLCAALLSVRT